MKYAPLQVLTPSKPCPEVPLADIKKHIRILKNNKAPDPFGVTAEYLKCADHSIVPIVTSIVNHIFTSQQIPDNMKIEAITPVIKKQKAKSNPGNYHCITVNSMMGKVLDKGMVPHT